MIEDQFAHRVRAALEVGQPDVDMFIGVADPSTGNPLVFVTAGSPGTSEKTVALRNGVTNGVFAALT